MNQRAMFFIGLAISTGCLATNAAPTHLLCQMENPAGESLPNIDLSINEGAGTIKLLPKGWDVPATFSTGEITWAYEGTPFEHRLNRLSGELTVTVVRPGRGDLRLQSGTCSVASKAVRKF